MYHESSDSLVMASVTLLMYRSKAVCCPSLAGERLVWFPCKEGVGVCPCRGVRVCRGMCMFVVCVCVCVCSLCGCVCMCLCVCVSENYHGFKFTELPFTQSPQDQLIVNIREM